MMKILFLKIGLLAAGLSLVVYMMPDHPGKPLKDRLLMHVVTDDNGHYAVISDLGVLDEEIYTNKQTAQAHADQFNLIVINDEGKKRELREKEVEKKVRQWHLAE